MVQVSELSNQELEELAESIEREVTARHLESIAEQLDALKSDPDHEKAECVATVLLISTISILGKTWEVECQNIIEKYKEVVGR